jgi:hypothetical protein
MPVQAAQFIPEDMTDNLIRKLEGETSRNKGGRAQAGRFIFPVMSSTR